MAQASSRVEILLATALIGMDSSVFHPEARMATGGAGQNFGIDVQTAQLYLFASWSTSSPAQ